MRGGDDGRVCEDCAISNGRANHGPWENMGKELSSAPLQLDHLVMLTLAKFKQKPDLVSAPGAALVQFHAGCTLGPALQKMSRRWGCGVDVAVRRLLVMAMSGWKLRFSDSLADLSRFVRGSEDPFQRTCLLLRKWLAAWTTATGETLSDEDVEARFAMLLDTLRERRTSGQPVDLADILAVDSDD